jgi:hypothetical protein
MDLILGTDQMMKRTEDSKLNDTIELIDYATYDQRPGSYASNDFLKYGMMTSKQTDLSMQNSRSRDRSVVHFQTESLYKNNGSISYDTYDDTQAGFESRKQFPRKSSIDSIDMKSDYALKVNKPLNKDSLSCRYPKKSAMKQQRIRKDGNMRQVDSRNRETQAIERRNDKLQ